MPAALRTLTIALCTGLTCSCTPGCSRTSDDPPAAQAATERRPAAPLHLEARAPQAACERDSSCLPLTEGLAGLALTGRCVPPPMLPPGSETRETKREIQIADMLANCTAYAQLGEVCSVRCNVDPVIPAAFKGPAREAHIAAEADRFARWMRDRFGAEQSLVRTERAGQLQREWRWRVPGVQLSLSTWHRVAAAEADTRLDRHMAPRISLVYSSP